jgi:cell division protein ZapA
MKNADYLRESCMTGADSLAEKNKVTVRIAGNEYVISGDESPEYIQKIALFVDRKVQEITRKNHTLSTSMASVLTSVNLADEMFRFKESLNNTEFQLTELKRKNQELRDENLRLKSDYSKIKERELLLQTELTKREAEIKEVRNTINTISNNKNTGV